MGPSQREYDDIPGTYVFDSRRARAGRTLNRFCKSLDLAENRRSFADDPDGYVGRFDLTEQQHRAVLERDWLALLEHGGNMYYIFKIAKADRRSMQEVGGAMRGITEDEFRQMLQQQTEGR